MFCGPGTLCSWPDTCLWVPGSLSLACLLLSCMLAYTALQPTPPLPLAHSHPHPQPWLWLGRCPVVKEKRINASSLHSVALGCSPALPPLGAAQLRGVSREGNGECHKPSRQPSGDLASLPCRKVRKPCLQPGPLQGCTGGGCERANDPQGTSQWLAASAGACSGHLSLASLLSP